MELKNEQTGIATAFAVAFAAMVIIAIVWNFFTPFMEDFVFSYSQEQTENLGDYTNTWAWGRFIWNVWPIIMLIGLIIYVFLSAQRPRYGW